MREFSISSFKAHALSIVSAVAQTGERVLVTKRGKPMAYLVPAETAGTNRQPGRLAGTLTHEEDVVSPLGADIWEAAKDEKKGRKR